MFPHHDVSNNLFSSTRYCGGKYVLGDIILGDGDVDELTASQAPKYEELVVEQIVTGNDLPFV
jgi:hypothetical protein